MQGPRRVDGISSTAASEDKKADPLGEFVNTQVKRICGQYESQLANFVAAAIEKYELRGQEVLSFYEKELLEDRLNYGQGALQILAEKKAIAEAAREEIVLAAAIEKVRRLSTLEKVFSSWKTETTRTNREKQDQEVVEWKVQIEDKFRGRVLELQKELESLKIELDAEEKERADLEKKFKGFLHQGLEIVRENQN